MANSCHVLGHTKMMFVTAGFDEYFKAMPADTSYSPDVLISALNSELSEKGCPPTTKAAHEAQTTATTSKVIGSTNTVTNPAVNTAATPSPKESAGNYIDQRYLMLLAICTLAVVAQP